MQILTNLTEIIRIQTPLALALGNFDGVHRGHQMLLQKCQEESKKNFWASAVLLWNPHPAQVFCGNRKLKFINTEMQKNRLIEALGIQYLICLPFNAQIATLSPLEFVQKYLVELFGVKKVFVGFNYSFGHQGVGTPALLEKYGHEKGFTVSVIKPVCIGGGIVSSSLIRQKLAEGDIQSAANFLGYFPVLEGTVVPGKQRGSGLGFPTANIAVPEEQLLPSFGVYAAFAEYQEKCYPAILNIGIKPTFDGKQTTVEIHIPDFRQNLYRQNLKATLVKKIRDEQKFNSQEELSVQITRDLFTARQILCNYPFSK